VPPGAGRENSRWRSIVGIRRKRHWNVVRRTTQRTYTIHLGESHVKYIRMQCRKFLFSVILLQNSRADAVIRRYWAPLYMSYMGRNVPRFRTEILFIEFGEFEFSCRVSIYFLGVCLCARDLERSRDENPYDK